MNINNSQVMLIGASGGIGQATAKALAAAGARLILVGRNQASLSTLQSELTNSQQHQILLADISSPSGILAIKQLAQALAQQGQAIDVLINNAGYNSFALLSQRSAQQIEQELKVNLLAPMQICQALLSHLKQPGYIVNIGSTFGSIGYPGYTSYCAAKAGLQRFTEALDRELSHTGIRSFYLAPRATDTALNSQAVNRLNQQLGNKTDSPEVVAKHLLTVLRKEIPCKWIGWPEKFFARLNQLFPRLVAAAIDKQKESIYQHLNRVKH